jgi:hypothetical protein
MKGAGSALGELGVSTVFVQEDDYDLNAIGPLVLATLEGAGPAPNVPCPRWPSARDVQRGGARPASRAFFIRKAMLALPMMKASFEVGSR